MEQRELFSERNARRVAAEKQVVVEIPPPTGGALIDDYLLVMDAIHGAVDAATLKAAVEKDHVRNAMRRLKAAFQADKGKYSYLWAENAFNYTKKLLSGECFS